jgi:hypothetical protein
MLSLFESVVDPHHSIAKLWDKRILFPSDFEMPLYRENVLLKAEKAAAVSRLTDGTSDWFYFLY